MPSRHNQRQRKKLRLGEFKELGFAVRAALRDQLDVATCDAVFDDFIEHIEEQGLMAGGGARGTISVYVTSEMFRTSATEAQRESVTKWLLSRSEFTAIDVGPLTDAWHDHD